MFYFNYLKILNSYMSVEYIFITQTPNALGMINIQLCKWYDTNKGTFLFFANIQLLEVCSFIHLINIYWVLCFKNCRTAEINMERITSKSQQGRNSSTEKYSKITIEWFAFSHGILRFQIMLNKSVRFLYLISWNTNISGTTF